MIKRTKQILIITILMLLASSLISACKSATPTTDINAQKTGFAQTADAQASLTAAARPTETPSPTLEPTATPTETQQEGAETMNPTESGTSKNGGTDSPATATSITGVDDAQWRSQSPKDNTEFKPGESFTVTWKLENTGTSTWTTNYYIQFTSGDQMDAEEKVYLPYPVPPGKNVEISVDFKAPDETGEYKSVWSLINSSDEVFYTNFFIIINVVEN